MNKAHSPIPTFDAMMGPTIAVLKASGGSATTNEIYQRVVDLMRLSNDVLEVPHGDSSQNEVEYRLAWSRTYLKKYGLVDNSARGVWLLTEAGRAATTVDSKAIVRAVRDAHRSRAADSRDEDANGEERLGDDGAPEPGWQERLHAVLLSMQPAAFERLIQRMLRESGFIQVQVTGQSGDGGIDGIGIARINGFLSFQVLFQAKRYQGAVSPSQVRDFRGAMQGRTDKGLFITTGTFTREAVREATRDGAPPIDLIDGEQLVERLKDLRLGVRIQMVESVEVDEAWFGQI